MKKKVTLLNLGLKKKNYNCKKITFAYFFNKGRIIFHYH